MEAVWKIEVEDFPAFILVDDRGTTSSGNSAPDRSRNQVKRVARIARVRSVDFSPATLERPHLRRYRVCP